MENASSFFILSLQDLSNDLFQAQFQPCLVFALLIQNFKTFSKILNPQMILVSISFAFFYICGSVCKSKTLFQSTFFFCAPTLVVNLRLGLQYTSYQGQKICIFWRKLKNLTNNKLDNNHELDDFIV
jgi:hypothetical protein